MRSTYHRTSLTTQDPDFGQYTLERIYPDVRIAVPAQEAFELELVSATTQTFSVHQLRLRGASSTNVADLAGTLMIGCLLGGDLRLSAGRNQVPTDGPFMYPQGPVTSRWEELSLATIALDAGAVEDYAQQLAGSQSLRLRFHEHTPIDGAAARQWAGGVNRLYRDLLPDPQALNVPLIRSEAFRSLTQALLRCFPNTFLDQLEPGDGERALPATVRRAVAFMDAHLDEDIGLVEIAAAARLSPHGLLVAFRRYRNTTPVEYLRRARHDAARKDFPAADAVQGHRIPGAGG